MKIYSKCFSIIQKTALSIINLVIIKYILDLIRKYIKHSLIRFIYSVQFVNGIEFRATVYL